MLLNGRPVRLMAPEGEGEGGAGETPAQINARQNQSRSDRLNQIARGADARRAHELRDTEGERVVGQFEDGALEDTPEAREARAQREEEEAAQALDDNARAAAEEEASGQARARALQEEGVEELHEEEEEGEERPAARRSQAAEQEGDERVIDGIRHYATIVRGQLKWLTMKQLREQANVAAGAEQAVQDAQDAVRSAASAAARTPEPSVEIPSDEDLEVIISSAAIGEEEAVKKLARLIKQGVQPKTQVDVRSAVSEQIATQRAIERAERENKDLLSDDSLADVFKVRLSRLAKQKPTMMIVDAYHEVGEAMRKEFAPMLKGSRRLPSKNDRKRSLTPPPEGAARQRQEVEEEQEESVSSVIDQLAKGRGQQRAIRQRRY